jgi:hypothetical protein
MLMLFKVGVPFPFMKLPAELRLEVYRYRLVQQSPIELWPHVIDNVRWRSNIKRQKAFRRYESLYPALGLLRVSRLINEEASQVFYGENEFRFSGINGWMVFSAFLNTIGPSQYRFLTHVTIHVPFPGQEYLAIPSFGRTGFQERVCRHKLSQKRGFHCRLLQYGLKVPPNWNYDSSIRDCIAKLSKSNLKTFRLVLPPTYYINSQSHNKKMTRYWEMLIRFKRDIDTARALEARVPLKFDFVFLKLKDSFVDLAEDDFDREFRPWLVRYTGQVKRMFDRVKSADWIDSVLYGVYDYNGSYTVIDRESCERITGPRAFENEQRYEESWMDKL